MFSVLFRSVWALHEPLTCLEVCFLAKDTNAVTHEHTKHNKRKPVKQIPTICANKKTNILKGTFKLTKLTNYLQITDK